MGNTSDIIRSCIVPNTVLSENFYSITVYQNLLDFWLWGKDIEVGMIY